MIYITDCARIYWAAAINTPKTGLKATGSALLSLLAAYQVPETPTQ